MNLDIEEMSIKTEPEVIIEEGSSLEFKGSSCNVIPPVDILASCSKTDIKNVDDKDTPKKKTEAHIELLFMTLTTEEDAIKLFQEFDIIPKIKYCKTGEHLMKLQRSNGTTRWACHKGECSEAVSVRKGTWLEGSKLNLITIIRFIYLWAHDNATNLLCKRELAMNHSTVTGFRNYLTEICANEVLKADRKIGGIDLTVELEETILAQRKFHKGILLPEQWVFGGICRETNEVFLYSIEKRDRRTLEHCIKTRINPGSVIMSDMWMTYGGISYIDGYNYKLKSLNHGTNFVDPETGVSTLKINSLWDSINLSIKKRRGTQRKFLESYLCEFMWRKNNEGKDVFVELMKNISKFEFDRTSK